MRNRYRIDEKSHRKIINEMMSFVISNVLPTSLFNKNAEFEAYIAVMTFSSNGVEWYLPRTNVDKLVLSGYTWVPLNRTCFGGTSAIGDAIDAVIDNINSTRDDDIYESAPNIVVITNGRFDESFNKVLAHMERGTKEYAPSFYYSYKAVIDMNADDEGLRNIERFIETNASYGMKRFTTFDVRYCYKANEKDLDKLFYHACHTQTI
jgi:uncharacterized protein YegL